jgi:hypothetical protein
VEWHGLELIVDANNTLAWSSTIEASGWDEVTFGKRLDMSSAVMSLQLQQTVMKLIKNDAQGARMLRLGLCSPTLEISVTTPHCMTAVRPLDPPVQINL